ncbi:hypothetical protein SAMN04488583_5065 [Mycobacterium sp. 88mf]|nr:hypothetical protein SAMN04488583_5065 [Mycobacterium sp. 88mf]SFG12255.1 hypothetical protein SAMN04488582_105364 [Mycobacterium sp. 455mf]
MANLHRRTVLLGAGALAGLAGATVVGVAQAHAEPAPSDVDLALLRRTFALAQDARRSGSAPYGALAGDHGDRPAVKR